MPFSFNCTSPMASLLLVLLFLTMFHGSDAAWCTCRQDASNSALQKTIDYACGAGADCNPILQIGPCYNPNTVLAHCSYAANSYYQRKGEAQGACDFTGTATLTLTDPSYNGCTYPANQSVAGSSNNGTGSSKPGSTSSINSFNPSSQSGGDDLSPSGITNNMDGSDASFLLHTNPFYVFLIIFLCWDSD